MSAGRPTYSPTTRSRYRSSFVSGAPADPWLGLPSGFFLAVSLYIYFRSIQQCRRRSKLDAEGKDGFARVSQKMESHSKNGSSRFIYLSYCAKGSDDKAYFIPPVYVMAGTTYDQVEVGNLIKIKYHEEYYEMCKPLGEPDICCGNLEGSQISNLGTIMIIPGMIFILADPTACCRETQIGIVFGVLVAVFIAQLFFCPICCGRHLCQACFEGCGIKYSDPIEVTSEEADNYELQLFLNCMVANGQDVSWIGVDVDNKYAAESVSPQGKTEAGRNLVVSASYGQAPEASSSPPSYFESNLPDWYEMKVGPDGKKYYVNHHNQTTSYDPPTRQQIEAETRERNATKGGEGERDTSAEPPPYTMN